MYIICVHQPHLCSSPDGHFGLSHFLANMYSASMNIVYTSFCVNMFPVLRGTRLEMGLLGYRVMPYPAF